MRQRDDDNALIIDVKPGREQPWYAVQAMIYQYAVPRALPQYRDARMAGEIVYPTRTVKVPTGAMPNQFIQDLGSLIRRLADDRLAKRVPSIQECRFCPTSAADRLQCVDMRTDLGVSSTTEF